MCVGLFYLMFLMCRDFDTWNISKKKVIRKSWKIPFIVLLGFYGCLVLGITVFSREKGTKYILTLVPFSTWETDSRYLIFWVENLLLLMPLGMLLGFWLCKGADRILSFFRWSAFQSKRADWNAERSNSVWDKRFIPKVSASYWSVPVVGPFQWPSLLFLQVISAFR